MTSISNPAGRIDPELLRGRLQGIAGVERRALVCAVIDKGVACLGNSKGVDFPALEREAGVKPARELWANIEAPLSRIWSMIEELLQELRPLVVEHEKIEVAEGAPSSADGELGDFDFEPRAAPVAKRAPTPDERINETAWAMSFVLAGEIEAFRGRLPVLTKVSDAWELVSAVQDHIGHLKSSVTAIVTGIYASLPGGEEAPTQAQAGLELISSRELRARIFELRDDVLGIEASLRQSPQSSWLPLLERLQKLVEAFMFGPAFGWMRAGDKRSFLRHQRAQQEILALWSPLRAEPARRVVENMARYLEALEVINQRECLVNHDRAALKRVVEHLGAAAERKDAVARAAIGSGLAALAEVQWRDRELDKLLAQTLDPSRPPPLEAILRRAGELLGQLGG